MNLLYQFITNFEMKAYKIPENLNIVLNHGRWKLELLQLKCMSSNINYKKYIKINK